MDVHVRTFAPSVVVALLVAAYLVFGVPGPPAAMAAGGEIKVLETHQQVNYPSGVRLSITVESEAEIAEVRVYYRAAGSRQWGYAYADFDPGTRRERRTRVVATQSIPVREATYIAPGANVEYYFEVRDVEGNVVKTDRVVVEYLDGRFDWRRVSIGPLELVYHDISDSRVEETARALRQDLERVRELLQLNQVRSFKGVVYNSYADANAAFPVQSQTTTDHGTFAGYAFPEQRVFVGQGLDRRIIVHESTHLMFRDALGNRNVEVPAWLNEGFATYMEPNVRVRSSSDLYRRTPRLKAMQSVSGTPETIPVFYHKSVSVVAHLIEDYGEDRFRLLLAELAGGRTIEVALVGVYGFDEHGLDSSWAGLPIPEPAISVPTRTSTEQDHRREASSDSQTASESNANDPSSANVPSESGRDAGAQDRSEGYTQSQQQAPEERNDPSPFIFLDAWILAGVALLAIVVVSAKFIYKRLQQHQDRADDTWGSWHDDYIDD